MKDLRSSEHGRIRTFVLEYGKDDVKHLMGDMAERDGVMLSTRLLTFVDGREERIAHEMDGDFGRLHDGRAQVLAAAFGE